MDELSAQIRNCMYQYSRAIYRSIKDLIDPYADPDAQLGAVGVEAPGERLVRHLRVALDIPLHVPRGQRPALGHQKRHQRELADQLVGVVTHPARL